MVFVLFKDSTIVIAASLVDTKRTGAISHYIIEQDEDVDQQNKEKGLHTEATSPLHGFFQFERRRLKLLHLILLDLVETRLIVDHWELCTVGQRVQLLLGRLGERRYLLRLRWYQHHAPTVYRLLYFHPLLFEGSI